MGFANVTGRTRFLNQSPLGRAEMTCPGDWVPFVTCPGDWVPFGSTLTAPDGRMDTTILINSKTALCLSRILGSIRLQKNTLFSSLVR